MVDGMFAIFPARQRKWYMLTDLVQRTISVP